MLNNFINTAFWLLTHKQVGFVVANVSDLAMNNKFCAKFLHNFKWKHNSFPELRRNVALWQQQPALPIQKQKVARFFMLYNRHQSNICMTFIVNACEKARAKQENKRQMTYVFPVNQLISSHIVFAINL